MSSFGAPFFFLFLFNLLGACRRRTPRDPWPIWRWLETRLTDDLSDAARRFDPSPSALAVGMCRRVAKNRFRKWRRHVGSDEARLMDAVRARRRAVRPRIVIRARSVFGHNCFFGQSSAGPRIYIGWNYMGQRSIVIRALRAAYKVMALYSCGIYLRPYLLMAYQVMALSSYGLYSYGPT